MKPIVYAVIGVLMYGVQNAIIDLRLREYSTVGLLIGWYVTMLPLGLILFAYQKYSGQPIQLPPQDAMKIVGAVAVMFFIADFFYISAFTSGGNAIAITILAVLVPIVVAIAKFVMTREMPTGYHFAAFACATLAVALVAIGNTKKPIATEETAPAQLSQRAVDTN
ncbi:MAG: DMT family transporter [bacterium]|nr:DMT family transporter [bacterium]